MSSGLEALDGVYFLGGSRTLTLNDGVLRMKEHDPGRAVARSAVVHRSADTLLFAGPGFAGECPFEVYDGHLFLGVMTERRKGVFEGTTCNELLSFPFADRIPRTEVRSATWDEATGALTHQTADGQVQGGWSPSDPSLRLPREQATFEARLSFLGRFSLRGHVLLTPWTRDVGPVGLHPVPDATAAGRWQLVDGGTLDVMGAPPKPRSGISQFQPDLAHLSWGPDEDGVSYEYLGLPHFPHALVDYPYEALSFVQQDGGLARHLSGGCAAVREQVDLLERAP